LTADESDALPSLLAVLPPDIDTFDATSVTEHLQGIHEVDTMLDEVGLSLRLIPLEHRWIIRSLRSYCQRRRAVIRSSVHGRSGFR